MPMLVLPPAILDAIHDATGLWFNHLPVRAEDVLMALRARERTAGREGTGQTVMREDA